MSFGDWNVALGKIELAEGEVYLEYSDYNPDTPYINIAVSVVESLESSLSYYSGVQMFDILVDERKAGRIRFQVRPSTQGGHVILEQADCASITNVHQKMLSGKRVSFVGDNGDRFDFDINGLAGIEQML